MCTIFHVSKIADFHLSAAINCSFKMQHPKKYSAYHVLLSYMKALHLTFMQELFKLCLREIVVAYAYSNNISF